MIVAGGNLVSISGIIHISGLSDNIIRHLGGNTIRDLSGNIIRNLRCIMMIRTRENPPDDDDFRWRRPRKHAASGAMAL